MRNPLEWQVWALVFVGLLAAAFMIWLTYTNATTCLKQHSFWYCFQVLG